MKNLKKYIPELSAFFWGAIVMIFEILGSRMVGPYIGTSLFVWTSLIAIILGALSLWYYRWWKLADKDASLEIISLLFMVSSLGFLSLFLVKDFFLLAVSSNLNDIRMSSIIAALVLFSPISFFLGMISPIAVKIKMTKLSSGGETLGRVGSIGTLGSIIGTLAAWFFLIPFFWVDLLLLFLWILSLCISYINEPKKHLLFQGCIWVLLCTWIFVETLQTQDFKKNGFETFDTSYSHISIEDSIDHNTLKNIRVLKIDNTMHAGMYRESDELLFEYTKYYHLFSVFLPEAKNVVMFGWAAYSFPKSFLSYYPEKHLEVVEIDSKITDIAKSHFWLKDDKNLTITHQDARVFLNTTKNTYDAILWDAFWSFYSIPYQLTTLETVKKKYDILNKDGIVILNMIGALKWEKSRFIQAEYKTYQQIFPEVFVIPVETSDVYEVQNIMLIAAKDMEALNLNTGVPFYREWLQKKIYLSLDDNTKVLTDNYAPVDYYTSKLFD